MSSTYRDRRGAVFGLTVAEIFILLAFVLMLLLLALSRQWEDLGERSELEALSEAYQNLKNEHGIEQPEEVVTLVKSEMQERMRLEDVIEQMETEQNELREELSHAETARREAETELSLTREATRAITTSDDRPLAEVIAEMAQAQTAAENEAERLRKVQERGVNPPCWYTEVPTSENKTREKPIYTFLIAVFDDGIEVLRGPTPIGSASDDDRGRTYQSEASTVLELQELPYSTRLSNSEFVRAFSRIHDAGKTSDVRSYSCVFFVKVWDKTSVHAKDTWKNTYHNYIEGLFGTYLVEEDPWPGEA